MTRSHTVLTRTLVAAIVVIVSAWSRGGCADEPRTETQKIEALISHIEELKDAKFVRNGVEYDSKTAAEFLRSKWKTHKKEIKTAEDFIEKAASRSSTSGKPYLIRRKDGGETPSGEYLKKRLEAMEVQRDETGGGRIGGESPCVRG